MSLVDTHCHIHEADYSLPVDEVIERAHQAAVHQIYCVGTSQESSRLAVEFASKHQEVSAIVGVHPHDTKDGYAAIAELAKRPGVIGVGEIGLDYYYEYSDRKTQLAALEAQIEIALENDLPIAFHVRDAFDDFWPIFHKFKGIRGELHSFTDSMENLQKALAEGLYIGVNGISTFTKNEAQQAIFDAIPLDRLLLETDAPFLTPNPFRGKVNEPAYVRQVAEYHAKRRGISFEEIANATTQNALRLYTRS